MLLLRSSLLRRYPNAIIYLTPALTGTPNPPPPDIFPIFNGAMEPDITFFGFPITSAAAIGDRPATRATSSSFRNIPPSRASVSTRW